MSMRDFRGYINIDSDSCVNCHTCISVCPVKFCNNGEGDIIEYIPELCIGCGKCIEGCPHDARTSIDDSDIFFDDLKRGKKILAIVAPAVAANYKNDFMKINGFLKKLGINEIFDVSFGAELTVKSYIKYIKENNPLTTISSACPSIVNYIQIYKPELIKYLTPCSSPMIHTIKMIKEFYPEYKDYEIAAISPCIAKKKEFIEEGYDIYNIGFKSIQNYFKENSLNINDFPEVKYKNPPAERAVLFSSPGGLMETINRWISGIKKDVRRIEGTDQIYNYLGDFNKSIAKGVNPKIVDCLSCEFGCNKGPLTINREETIDEIEFWVNNRMNNAIDTYKKEESSNKVIEENLNRFYKEKLFNRKFVDLSAENNVKIPNEKDLEKIYHHMYKYEEKDFYNCMACGYNSCETMGVAIYNDLNKPENCHFYLLKETEISREEIAKKERKLSSILENTTQGFVEIDKEGIIRSVNSAMKNIFNDDEAIGKYYADFFQPDDKKKFEKEHKNRIKGEKSSYIVRVNSDTEKDIIIKCNGAPIFNEKNEVEGSYALVSDITDIISYQREIEDLNKNLESRIVERTKSLENANKELQKAKEVADEAAKSKSDFLANMSHELRTPLNGVIGASSLAAEEDPKGKVKRYLKIINSSGKQLLGLINDILDFSKIESGNFEINIHRFYLDDMIDHIMSQFVSAVSEKNIEFLVDLEIGLPLEIYSDQLRIQQILTNILGNAFKFTPEDGTVVLGISYKELENSKISVQFYIKDDGIGIPKDKQEKLFSPFTQADSSTSRKYGGTGLGLSISKELVGLMDGEIWLESEEGEGTTFYFNIVAEHDTESNRLYLPDFYDLKRLNILVIDDNPNTLDLIEKIIKRNDNIIDRALSGNEGIELLKIKKYELIIIDWVMEKLNGIETINYIRDEMKIKTPIILMSAFEKHSDIEDELSGKISGFIAKPFTVSTIYDSIMSSFSEKEHPKISDINKINKNKMKINKKVLKDKQVLVAEDNPTNQEILLAMLRNLGGDIEIVTNGLEAVNFVKDKKFDIILMDVQMPIKDGLQATREIRERYGKDELPILAITAHALKEEIDKCFAAGMNSYITKPFSKDKLINGLSNFIEDYETDNVEIESKENKKEDHPKNMPGIEIEYALKAHDIDFESYLKILSRFLSITEGLIKELKKFYFAEDLKKVNEVSHNIKGSSANVGVFELQHSSKVLEEEAAIALKRNEELKMRYLDRVESDFLVVKKSIQELQKQNQSSAEKKQSKKMDISTIKPLIDELYEALDDYDPVKSGEIIEKLKPTIDIELLDKIVGEIDEYEFENAEKELDRLCEKYNLVRTDSGIR